MELVATAALSLVTGVALGPLIWKREKGLSQFKEDLSKLQDEEKAIQLKILKFTTRANSLRNISRLSLCISSILGLYLAYSQLLWSLVYQNPLLVFTAVSLFLGLSVVTTFLDYRKRVYVKKLEELKEKREQRLSLLHTELGEQLLNAVQRDNECSPECKERTKHLEEKLHSNINFIKDLASFQWCEACTLNKPCSNMCGSKFWRFTKDALTRHNLKKN